MLNLVPLPYRWLMLVGLAAALMGFGWVKGAEHGEAKLVAYQLQVQKDDAAANQRNAATTQALQQRVLEAQNAGIKRIQKAQAAADAATVANGSLRNDLDQLKRDLPNLTKQAVDQYAAALDDVLAECSGRYTAVAAKATGHANDVQTLIEAWPVTGPE